MRTRNLFAAVAIAGTALTVGSAPASAHSEVCVAQGTITSTPLYFPGVNGLTIGTPGAFTLATEPALTVCVAGDPSLTASGTFGPGPAAYCGHVTATGTIERHNFTFVSAGTLLIFTGIGPPPHIGVTGTASFVPDAVNGQNCLAGATRYIVTIAVTLV